jgi:tRNA A-37 threonylcarbamoyl transferase component Bud32
MDAPPLAGRFAIIANSRTYVYPSQMVKHSIGKIVIGEDKIRDLYYVNHIDTGDYSSTYTVFDGTSYFVLKHIFNLLEEDMEIEVSPADIENEMEMHLRAAAIGIAPQIEFAFLFELGGVIVMERIDLTLEAYLTTMPLPPIETLSSDILNLLALLHSLNIRHGDPHNENIMFKAVGAGKYGCGIYKPYLIDYGMSIYCPDSLSDSDIRRDYYTLMDAFDSVSAELEVPSITQLANEIGYYVETHFPPDSTYPPGEDSN